MKHYGKFRGKVLNNKDPKDRGRVLIAVPSLMGSNELGWAEPCFPPNQFFQPEINDLVWIEFEEGKLENPIYVGTISVSSSHRKTYPYNQMIKAGEFSIVIDKETETLSVMDSSGNKIDLKSGSGDINVTSTGTINLDAPTVNAPNLQGYQKT